MKKKKKGGKRPCRSGLVSNVATAAALVGNQYTEVTFNLSAVPVRKETLNGRTYTVVPVVMLKEGVLNGSRGPLFYPAEEIQKTPEIWNHKPIVVYHPPEDKGSACQADILANQQIGMIMNTRWVNKTKELKAEAWVEESLAKKVDNRVWTAIEKKTMMEQSTGLFTDNEMTEGEFEGEAYVAIARNYRADHLAVLPDVKGAFSMERGGGFIRNEANFLYPDMPDEDKEEVRNVIINLLAKKEGNALKLLVANEMAHEEMRCQLAKALEGKYPPPAGDQAGYSYPYIEAVYDDKLVFHLGGKIFALGYSKNNAGVKLDGTPREVVRFAEYRTKSGASLNAATSSTNNHAKEKNIMDKTKIVDDLIANHGHSEESRSMLMGLEDNALKAIHNAATVTANKLKSAAPQNTKSDDDEEEDAAPKKKKKGMAKNQAADDADEEEAPETVPALNADQQAALAYGQRRLKEDKARLVKTITANAANKFTVEVLNTMSIDHLESIASLASATPTVDPTKEVVANRFDGMAPVAILTSNEKSQEALVMPSMWDDKKK